MCILFPFHLISLANIIVVFMAKQVKTNRDAELQ